MKNKMFYSLFILSLLLVLFNNALAMSLKEIAVRSASGLGKVTQSGEGENGQVVLFEENHASLFGQVEIAHMLVRLYKNYGLRHIALEGAVPSQNLKPPWAKTMGAQDRLEISARLLGDGELSSAEFMASAFNDVTVVGVDDEHAYKLELDSQASSSTYFYLILIAEQSLTSIQAEKINELLAEKKVKEAYEFVINADPWTRETYQKIFSKHKIVSIEETLRLLDDIKREAQKRGVEVPLDIEEGMERKKEFFKAAGRRSDTMVKQIAKLSPRNSDFLVAATIGAAHTVRMSTLLRERSIAFAVIRPNALNKDGGTYSQTIDFERKLKGLSVDMDGLGGLLVTHRKPRPVISTQWLSNKANIYYVTSVITKKLLVEGDAPPYDNLRLPAGIFVDPKKITRIGDEVIFPIEVVVGTQKETIWVRAAHSEDIVNSEKRPENIEDRIQALLAEASGGGGGKEPPVTDKKQTSDFGKRKDNDGVKKGNGPKKPRSGVRQVTKGIFAKFSKNRKAIEKESVLVGAAS